ncbi:MAG: peptidoglycan-binding domain-containing protein [Kiloniellales bacterium]
MRSKKTTFRKGKKGTSKVRKSGARKAAPRKKAAQKPAAKPKTTRPRRAKKAAPAHEPEQSPAPVAVEVLPAGKPQSAKPKSSTLESIKPEIGVTPAAAIPDSVILLDADEMANGESRKQRASGERSHRAKPNKLVPTNAVHPTERRVRRRQTYGRALVLMTAVAVVGLFVLSDEGEPPDVTAFEQQGAVPMDAPTLETAGKATSRFDHPLSAETELNRFSNSADAPAPKSKAHAVRIVVPFDQGTVALQVPLGDSGEPPKADRLSADEITEMERMLARLVLGSKPPDGIFDTHTASAIRLYQQIAGLPINGEPSQALLTDMREVVKILDNGG